ncbi:MAG: hypothetical protein JWO78_1042 [Micavibrio sp.]|nr:hypothetical protein [Micavibrio sp.]
MPHLSIDLAWWITVIELPFMGGLFWMIWHVRREGEEAVGRLRDVIDSRNAQMREGLSAFKLEVAKNYAAAQDLKDVEDRLVGHLLRIESKLDVTALKTEALKAGAQGQG